MTAVPATTPPAIPVLPTVAMPVAELLQLPPLTASVRLWVLPVQIVGDAGKITAGPGLTVTVLVIKQPPEL
jgi:hypothetical protein